MLGGTKCSMTISKTKMKLCTFMKHLETDPRTLASDVESPNQGDKFHISLLHFPYVDLPRDLLNTELFQSLAL